MDGTVKNLFISLALILQVGLISCSSQDPGNGEILARINDFELQIGDFQRQLNDEVEFDDAYKVTAEAKYAFLQELIKKELLIQEAKRLKLDTKEAFMRTIQRYWESTLIRDLLNLQGKKISQKTLVSEDDIANRYASMMRSDPSLGPVSQYRDHIVAELKEEKKTANLRQWIDGLEGKATIKINRDLL